MPDRVQQAVWRHFDTLPRKWTIQYRGDEAERLRLLRGFGVRHHTALAYAHRAGMAAWLNDFTLEFATRVETALPCFTFYPEPGAGGYVRDALARGGRVAKVHLQVGKFDPMHHELHAVWDQVEAARTPVIIHAGAVPDGSRGEEWCGMGPVRNLLRRWPGLVLVLAHMGAPDYPEAVALAQEFPQLFMDTAMVLVDGQTGFEYPDALLNWLAGSGERVLFGSDFPSFPHDYAAQVRGLATRGFGEPWLRRVLWQNAALMFGVPTPTC